MFQTLSYLILCIARIVMAAGYLIPSLDYDTDLISAELVVLISIFIFAIHDVISSWVLIVRTVQNKPPSVFTKLYFVLFLIVYILPTVSSIVLVYKINKYDMPDSQKDHARLFVITHVIFSTARMFIDVSVSHAQSRAVENHTLHA